MTDAARLLVFSTIRVIYAHLNYRYNRLLCELTTIICTEHSVFPLSDLREITLLI